MKKNIQLRQLHLHDEAVFNLSLELWKNDMGLFSFVLEKDPNTSYTDMLKTLNEEHEGVNIRPDKVPATMLYAFADDLIIGRFHIRHSLNDFLLARGGNVGYAVARDYRKQGVATEMMRQGLIYCKDELHLEKILVTCGDSNLASHKLIENYGGVLENKAWDDGHGEQIRRYWIRL